MGRMKELHQAGEELMQFYGGVTDEFMNSLSKKIQTKIEAKASAKQAEEVINLLKEPEMGYGKKKGGTKPPKR